MEGNWEIITLVDQLEKNCTQALEYISYPNIDVTLTVHFSVLCYTISYKL